METKMAEEEGFHKNGPKYNKLGCPHISYEKALKYMKSDNSCLFEVENVKEIGLLPKFIGQIDNGIRESLDTELLKHSEELNGIIVAYNKVKCHEYSGCIHDETPFVFFKATVKYIVFKPQIGMKLKGVVNKIGHGHIGCLVHGCFNASIEKPNLNDSIKKQRKSIKRLISNMDIGTELIFKIVGLDVHNDILSIKGIIDEQDLEKIRNERIKSKNLSVETLDTMNHKKHSSSSELASPDGGEVTLPNGDSIISPLKCALSDDNNVADQTASSPHKVPEEQKRSKKSAKKKKLDADAKKIDRTFEDISTEDTPLKTTPKKKRKKDKYQ